jgi:asparagine synthase (glutamine-hydrolysing)
MLRGIEKLPPATLLTVEAGRVETRRYWRIPSATDRSTSEQEWVERVRARLDESVRMQMVSDVPIGAFLSGGVDSSAVVGFMARHTDQPIKTYAIGFKGASADEYYNELPYARRVAELFHTDHREIVVRPDVVSLLPRLLWHMDEPIADTAFITTYLVSEFARRDVTVILSGVGGDELFGGYRRYLGNHYQARFNRCLGGCAAPPRRSAHACRATVTRRCSTIRGWPRVSSKARVCRSRSATARMCKCSRCTTCSGSCVRTTRRSRTSSRPHFAARTATMR